MFQLIEQWSESDVRGYDNLPTASNYLNLPGKLIAGPQQIKYIYDAGGTKLAKVAPNGTTTWYAGSFVYEGSSLKYILHNEGMITMDGTPQYQYHIKDHLGNNRLTISADGTLTDQADYYPFGMLMTNKYNGGINNKYLYNGKELQDDAIAGGNLDWYDYGARMYDPTLGRWHAIDPLAEKYYPISPYVYVANNPLKFVDPDGMRIDDYFNNNGEYLGTDNAETDKVKVIDQNVWDDNKQVSADGIESIDHATGAANSTLHSESGLSTEASLNVYSHYNSTDLPLLENDKAVMTFTGRSIKINIEGNNRPKTSDRIVIADDANIIKSAFSHEGQHYMDYKTLGREAYLDLPRSQREGRAYNTQMSDPSWQKVPQGLRDAIKSTATERYKILFRIEP